eukprot:6814069-Alexandrium_andersonii.AAC.1
MGSKSNIRDDEGCSMYISAPRKYPMVATTMNIKTMRFASLTPKSRRHPPGLKAERPVVARHIQTHELHTGAPQREPPGFSLKTMLSASRNPSSRSRSFFGVYFLSKAAVVNPIDA